MLVCVNIKASSMSSENQGRMSRNVCGSRAPMPKRYIADDNRDLLPSTDCICPKLGHNINNCTITAMRTDLAPVYLYVRPKT